MNSPFCRILFLLSGLALAGSAHAQDYVVVDAAARVSDVSRRPVGINVNFLLDDDRNRPAALASLGQALREAGVKYLRYPGGEKADAYLWSVPPYTSSVPTLARWAEGEWPANQEWPSYDRALVQPDGRTFRTDPLDFDEFMAICREIDCVPTIVVCYDSMYKPAQPGGVAPTRAQLIETAREWVRYANLVRGYGIKYWEIGNESWLAHYNGGATAEAYARDLIEFSQAMKSVDPTISIGANGDSLEWWRTILTGAASAIDFLAVHEYPAYNWGSYSYYRDRDLPLTPAVDRARQALAAYAPAHRDRIKIAVTETGPADWTGAWPHVNDMGHAVVLFDMLARQLAAPDVAFTQFWNTRWSGNDTAAVPRVLDALDRDNLPLATGRVLAIWGELLKEQMVASTSTSRVRTSASYSPADRALTVFLVNKGTGQRDAVVEIRNFPAALSIERRVLSGTGPDDPFPVWSSGVPMAADGNRIVSRLDPVSITVLEIRAAAPTGTPVPGTIEAEDFDSFLDWTPENHGGQYRSTAVDIQRSSDLGGGYNVGWFDPGEWLEYPVDVTTGGAFEVAVRVASPAAGASVQVFLNGVPVATLPVPDTGGWQTWRTVRSEALFMPAGAHRIRITTTTGGFNLNWLSVTAPGDAARTVPGRIEAEDFDAFLDWSEANHGGQYRSTPVDIERSADVDGGHNVGWFEAGEWLEYVVAASKGGTYGFSVRVASPLSGARLRMTIDGSAAGVVNVPNTGSWQSWATVRLPDASIGSGIHRIRVSSDTGGFNLNWIAVAVAGTDATVPRRVEAEDFDAFHDWTPGNNGGQYRTGDVDIEVCRDAGGGFDVGWFDRGEWLEYVIDVPAAGWYRIAARVASPATGATIRVAAGGATADVVVPNTGGWQAWQTVTTGPIHLGAGPQRLRVSTETGGLNLNYLELRGIEP